MNARQKKVQNKQKQMRIFVNPFVLRYCFPRLIISNVLYFVFL